MSTSLRAAAEGDAVRDAARAWKRPRAPCAHGARGLGVAAVDWAARASRTSEKLTRKKRLQAQPATRVRWSGEPATGHGPSHRPTCGRAADRSSVEPSTEWWSSLRPTSHSSVGATDREREKWSSLRDRQVIHGSRQRPRSRRATSHSWVETPTAYNSSLPPPRPVMAVAEGSDRFIKLYCLSGSGSFSFEVEPPTGLRTARL